MLLLLLVLLLLLLVLESREAMVAVTEAVMTGEAMGPMMVAAETTGATKSKAETEAARALESRMRRRHGQSVRSVMAAKVVRSLEAGERKSVRGHAEWAAKTVWTAESTMVSMRMRMRVRVAEKSVVVVVVVVVATSETVAVAVTVMTAKAKPAAMEEALHKVAGGTSRRTSLLLRRSALELRILVVAGVVIVAAAAAAAAGGAVRALTVGVHPTAAVATTVAVTVVAAKGSSSPHAAKSHPGAGRSLRRGIGRGVSLRLFVGRL